MPTKKAKKERRPKPPKLVAVHYTTRRTFTEELAGNRYTFHRDDSTGLRHKRPLVMSQDAWETLAKRKRLKRLADTGHIEVTR